MPLRRSQQGRLAAALLAAALVATGCPSERGPSPAPDPGPAPVGGGTLRVALAGDVDSLDPHRAARPSSWFVARAVHRGLYAFASAPAPAGAEPVPDLAAAAPAMSAGRRRLSIQLRDGVRFADGRPVTARDVVASLERLIRAARGVAGFLDPIVGAGAYAAGRAQRIAGLAAVDDRTVRIELRRPVTDLPWVLAHPQAAIVPADTAAPGRVDPRRIVGAGPYRLDVIRPERRITLVRNERWGEDDVRGAYLDALDLRIAAGPADARARVRDGRADLLLDPGPPDLGVAPSGEDVRVVRVASGCVRYLFLNTSVAPFDDGTVRRAVAAAVERDTLPDVPASATATGSLLPPTVVGHRQAVPAASPARARAALDSAGYGDGFETTLVVADAPRDRSEAVALRRSLRRVGITLSLRTVHPAVLYPAFYEDPASRVPMGIASWCADWPGLAGRNVLGTIADPRARRASAPNPVYANLRADALARAIAAASRTPRTRADATWAAADGLIVGTAALIPLVAPLQVVEVSRTVGGLVGAPMFPRGDPAGLWLDPAAGRSG